MPVELKALAPRDAIAALAARGKFLDPSFAWQERYADDHARAFTVAKSAGFDILNDLYTALQTALEEGRTERDFAAMVTPVLQEKGWWGRKAVVNPKTGLPEMAQLGSPRRLQLIFDANMRVSYAAGQWANFERNKAVRPFLRYVHLEGQEHPRLQHHLWHNTCLPVDHPWWDTHAAPNGWHCHCHIQSLSQRDVDRMRGELKFEPPPEEMRPWLNKLTGETRLIDAGIDPGWDGNPGKAGYLAQVNSAFASKIATAEDDLAAAAVVERVQSDAFRQFIEKPQGDMPALILTPDLREAIGGMQKLAVLSADTMKKQLREHPELTLADYRRLPLLGEKPTLVIQDGDRTVVLIREADDDRWLVGVVKATVSGKASYLTSFRYGRDKEVERLLGRAGVKVILDRR